MPRDDEITHLLARVSAGDDDALGALLPIVYAELRTIAARLLRGEREDHTLQPTALVHEAYLRLVGEHAPLNDRRHFFAIAAREMRRVLVEHARARQRLKRGGGNVRVTLTDNLQRAADPDPVDVVALDSAMTKLESRYARKVRVVELMYFAGLSAEEASKVLGVTSRTIERDWQYARVWLLRELSA